MLFPIRCRSQSQLALVTAETGTMTSRAVHTHTKKPTLIIREERSKHDCDMK